jgi:hypothetical protein
LPGFYKFKNLLFTKGDITMNRIKFTACALLTIAVTLFSCAAVLAGESDKQARASLAGIRGIGVVVEDLAPDAVQEGFTAQLVQADVEQKLRAAGIKVLNEEELVKASGMPYLYINIFTFKDDELYAYHITLELRQMVSLARKPGIKLSASTWKARAGGTVGIRKVVELRAFVKDAADQFIGVWKAANP